VPPSHLMRFAFAILSIVVLASCSNSERGDIIDVHDFTSPDGRNVVTVFGETFYNTTGYNRHVHLRRAGQKPGRPGNVLTVGPGEDVSVSWTSPTNLSVRYRFESARPTPATTKVYGITITFSDMRRFE